jgi:hypothetical protein
MLEAALAYVARGVPVFPVLPNAKSPLSAHGFKDATTDAQQVRAWWGASPLANIGMPTGTTSGIFVVDVDPRNGGDVEWAMLVAQNGEPVTRRVRTPSGGIHLYFRCPAAGIKTRAHIRPGIDVRGDGGYVVVPPSVVDGNPYATARG